MAIEFSGLAGTTAYGALTGYLLGGAPPITAAAPRGGLKVPAIAAGATTGAVSYLIASSLPPNPLLTGIPAGIAAGAITGAMYGSWVSGGVGESKLLGAMMGGLYGMTTGALAGGLAQRSR